MTSEIFCKFLNLQKGDFFAPTSTTRCYSQERLLYALAHLPFWSPLGWPFSAAQSSMPAPALAATTQAARGEGPVSPPLTQQSFHILQIVLFSTSLITETNMIFFSFDLFQDTQTSLKMCVKLYICEIEGGNSL